MPSLTNFRRTAAVVAALALAWQPASAVTPLADVKPVFTSINPPSGVVGTAYSYTFEATGDPAPVITVSAGTLPAGLSFAGGTLSGTPTTAGQSTFTVKATNTAGNVSKSVTVRIGADASRPDLAGGALPTGTVEVSYRVYIEGLGYPTPTISLQSGSLPDGLTLANNVISGIPIKAGAFNFTLRAENVAGVDSKEYSLTILAKAAPPVITEASPFNGQVLAPYFYDFKAEGYPVPRFSLSSGALPPGLVLSANGNLSGRPTKVGVYTFKVAATNNIASVESGTLTITIGNPPCQSQGQYSIGFAKGSTKLSATAKLLLKQNTPKSCVGSITVTGFARSKESAKTAAALAGGRAARVSAFIKNLNPELTVNVVNGGTGKKAICQDDAYRCAVVRIPVVTG